MLDSVGKRLVSRDGHTGVTGGPGGRTGTGGTREREGSHMRIPWSGWRPSTRSGRGSPPGGRRKWRLLLLLLPAMGIAMVCQLSLTGAAGAATAATTAKTGASGGVTPNAVNELDCNGWSKAYGTVRKLAGSTCVD